MGARHMHGQKRCASDETEVLKAEHGDSCRKSRSGWRRRSAGGWVRWMERASARGVSARRPWCGGGAPDTEANDINWTEHRWQKEKLEMRPLCVFARAATLEKEVATVFAADSAWATDTHTL
ncbi:hypothetical protein V7S43_005460 [Phytophthora oleae]|uniref:Uncharacterized protein n=1 Tax=Phytophthora oleae TaxID=2107226 RepID=A0ABD3FRX4_9STRA